MSLTMNFDDNCKSVCRKGHWRLYCQRKLSTLPEQFELCFILLLLSLLYLFVWWHGSLNNSLNSRLFNDCTTFLSSPWAHTRQFTMTPSCCLKLSWSTDCGLIQTGNNPQQTVSHLQFEEYLNKCDLLWLNRREVVLGSQNKVHMYLCGLHVLETSLKLLLTVWNFNVKVKWMLIKKLCY